MTVADPAVAAIVSKTIGESIVNDPLGELQDWHRWGGLAGLTISVLPDEPQTLPDPVFLASPLYVASH